MKKISLHPLFVLYIIFLLFLQQFQSIFVYLIVVIFHEFGHSIVAKKLGYVLSKVVLMPYGVCLNYNITSFYPNDEILIAIAGPFVNLFLSICCFALWWIFPSLFMYTKLFCYANLVIFVFNLLPCYPLDGGRVLSGFLAKRYEYKNVVRFVVFLNIVVCFVFIVTFFIGLLFGVVNINLIIISLFLFVGIFQPNNKSSYNYLTLSIDRKKILDSGRQIKFTLIKSSEMLYKVISKISKHKFNVFYVICKDEKIKVITEFSLAKLSTMYKLTSTLEDILT